MADPLLTVAYDQNTFASIARFAQFKAILEYEMGPAMHKVGDLLVESMIANTWIVFDNPTGALAGSITAEYPSVLEAYIKVDVPYAWRMEAGFTGVDSIGRLYNEPGKPYAQPALNDYQDAIVQILSEAAANAFAIMGGR